MDDETITPDETETVAEFVTRDELMKKRREVVLANSGFKSLDSLARERRQIDWLVKDVVECGTHAMLFGPPESGKTLVLFDIAYCVATGKKWRNRRVKQGAVFYLCGEGHGGLGRRAAAWRTQNGIPEDEDYPIYCSELPVSLLDNDASERVCAEINAMCDVLEVSPVLVAIDTLARNFGPGDENSATDMGKVISNIDNYLIKELGAGVITNHHTGLGSQERARGSSAMLGALDNCYRIAKDEHGLIQMDCTKSKDFQPPNPFTFRLRVHKLGYQDEDGEDVTGATVESIQYEAIDEPPPLKGYQLLAYNEICDIYCRAEARLRFQGKVGTEALPVIDRAHWRSNVIKIKIGPDVAPSDVKYERAKRSTNNAIKALIDMELVSVRDNGVDIYPTKYETAGN